MSDDGRWVCERGHSNPKSVSDCPICAAIDRARGND